MRVKTILAVVILVSCFAGLVTSFCYTIGWIGILAILGIFAAAYAITWAICELINVCN